MVSVFKMISLWSEAMNVSQSITPSAGGSQGNGAALLGMEIRLAKDCMFMLSHRSLNSQLKVLGVEPLRDD